jgi:hypothetical protein
VRQKDPASHRPILIAPQNDWLPLSKVADVLLATRPDAHALAETDFAQWLDERATLARPGTPLWVTVPTQPSQLVCDQIKALVPHSQLPLIDERQIESLTRSAGIHGCRGFLYESTTPLNANDDVSRRRALALEFQNRQLQLLEPWLTLGKQVSRVTSTDASATATILQVERTRLLVLDPHAGDAQSTAKPPAASRPINATFIVPGVPDSNQVFLLSAAHLEPLSSKRVAGGMQITVDRTAGDMVLLTEDSNVISNFRERLSREGPKAARLERDLLAARVRAGTAEVQRFPQLSVDGAEYLRAIGAANAQIARSDALLNSGNFSESFRTASTAYLSLTQWADYEQQKLAPAAPLASSPIAGCSDNIAEQLEFQKMLSSLRPGDNQLSGGDFEELTQLMQFGWQHVSQPLPGIVPKAELSAVSPHSGRYCLQLSAIAVPPAAAPQIIARPLVRITSPPVHVASGDILVITGYVRIPKPIAGNLDGLTVVDTLGGPELALNIRQSPDWQYFRLIRAAGESSDETVSFLLNGLGNVSIDDVAIHVLSPPSARRLPATAGGLQLVDPHAAGRSLPVSTTSRPR